MAFPQKHVGKSLYLNVLIVVRNFNPLIDDAVNALSPAWVNCNLRLQAMVVDSPEDYPRLDLPATPYDLTTVSMPAEVADIFTSLQSRFKITKTERADNSAANVKQVKKYLPLTYRQSFNFTSPSNKNICVTGDEYHCAVKSNPLPEPTFVQDTDETSWGKVFAFCLRHKELAKKCGFIHEQLIINLADNTYKNGGWLYVDLHPECSYYKQTYGPLPATQTYAKRYAARIPKLDLTKGRNLFAAVEFPVLIDNNPPLADYPVAPSGDILDEMFIEATEYDDGFCKIVHSYQPVSNSLLKEEQDDEHPVTNDIGIRMGWDDEQLAAWHARQLGADPISGNRPDAPLGVFQYRIDVREKSDDPINPNQWIPLCRVRYDKQVQLEAVIIGNKNDELEMGVEVYPAQLDADAGGNFWLPSYFTQWIGNSLVLQDEDAIAIYQKDKIDKNHLGSANQYDPPGEQPFKATKNDFYKAVGLDKIDLLYGQQYEFRVRMADTTGGGPAIDDDPVYDSASPVTLCHFVRHVIPQTFNFITPLPVSDTDTFISNTLSVKRPLLGYPAILFTGAYKNAVQKLIDDGNAVITRNEKRDIGLYDPDVSRMEVLVEIKALGMDTTIRKRDAKDNYALLYTTTRSFPKNFDAQLDVPFTFIDAPVLSFIDSQQLSDLGLHTSGKINIDERTDLVLPTARDIRITVRPLTVTKPGYYGGVNPDGSNRTELRGMPSSFVTRKAAISEKNLFKPTGEQMMIRGIYLQPDEAINFTADINQTLVANLATDDRIPTMIQRLSAAIGSDDKGMSLLGQQGQRWQFGASRFIRHTAAPDNTSITFATKTDLLNHWIVPLTLLIDRDWTWDGVEIVGMEILRRKIFLRDAMQLMGFTDRDLFLKTFGTAEIMTNAAITAGVTEERIGDLELKHAINIQALVQSDRSQTYCCFIDAAEPKQQDDTKFPDELLLSYRITVNFLKDGVSVPQHDDDTALYLHLPVTTIPTQVPKVVSAGMAFSKYVRDKDYANTETRKKYLWVEFDKPPADPNDAYYARMLAYAPDTLLANWEFDMMIAPQEPSLPIEPEPIRIITAASSDDKTGLHAMQEMIKANDSDVHYLVPLPPGLHTDSLELFGFFTYEFRVGHKIPWSTAQARFGRQLRNTGVQHPLPQLYCNANRNEKDVIVTAPYAQTVFDGRNVTAKPPRTEIWALLYAQVRMADDSDERNVLLSDKRLFVPQLRYAAGAYFPYPSINSDATPQGVTGWSNSDVENMLELYGLPLDSSLSILCVEMMPGYENFLINERHLEQQPGEYAFIRSENLNNKKTLNSAEFKNFINRTQSAMKATRLDAYSSAQTEEYLSNNNESNAGARPLTSDLGNYRILRTSLLVAVPEVCCTNC